MEATTTFEAFKLKASSVVSTAFICTPQDATLYWKRSKKKGRGRGEGQGVILNFGGNRQRCRHGSSFDLARHVASSRNDNNGGLHSSDSPTRLTLASPRLSVAMADQWLLRLSRKETNTLHSLIHPPPPPPPSPPPPPFPPPPLASIVPTHV